MNKKLIIIAGALIATCIAVFFVFGKYFKSNTNFTTPKEYLYIKTGSTYDDIVQTLTTENLLQDINSFKSVAKQLNYSNNIKPGKYKIEQGNSNYTLVRRLRSGNQEPVQLVLKKYRLKQDLARQIANKLEPDSTAIINLLNNNKYLKTYGLDSICSIAAFTPNTYEFYWNSTPEKVFEKIFKAYQKFWTNERIAKATKVKLSPTQVMTLASIVDEETQQDTEKRNIASVYLNRLAKNMKLQADPTVKYALGDFAIKRVLLKHLQNPSAYNTYYANGLPPGPICTPRLESIEAVLNAPSTNYLFFCASPTKIGFHNFASTDAEHLANAKIFQEWLNKRGIKK